MLFSQAKQRPFLSRAFLSFTTNCPAPDTIRSSLYTKVRAPGWNCSGLLIRTDLPPARECARGRGDVRIDWPAGGWFARHPAEEAAGDEQEERVEGSLQEGWFFGVADKAVQEVSDGAGFAKEVRGVPEGHGAEGDPAQFLHILHGVCQQAGGEDEQGNAHDAEEDTIVEAVSQAVDQHTEHD